MTLIGVYRAGDSWAHRLPAGVKVLALVAVTIAALLIASPWVALGLLAVSLLALLTTGVRLRTLATPLRFVTIAAVVLAGIMWWQQGAAAATVTVGRLLSLVLLAWTVSLTTRVSEMLATLQRAMRPLRHVGVRPEVIGMTIALAVRSVPLLMATVETAQQARRARGRGWSITALGVPVVVRSARVAEELGDALIARGYDPNER
ncbi:energy-coupling factor transporter transmembrane component T family protein [Janibacter alittae]|uniref:Energy-coupling factor transporter transmembrane protein EcfT n=1 Tax=Janibacter alittae TaxID=3115209 RepID=A0ABZ2MFZ9_9MICO